MESEEVVKRTAEEFEKRPFDFVTRKDIEAELVQSLREQLTEEGDIIAEMGGLGVQGNPVSYKEDYVAAMDSKLRENGGINRVHSQVKFKSRDHHYDVVVFSETISNSIQLSNNGSMRFDVEDVEAVIDLELVINRPYFPTEHSVRNEAVLQMKDSELREGLKKDRNNLRKDFKFLSDLPDNVETHYLLFSNLNYLFQRPLSRKERDQRIKIRIGEIAQQWIRDISGDTTVHYAHPRGSGIFELK